MDGIISSRGHIRAARAVVEVVDPTSFEARFLKRTVDLVQIIREGIPPREYHVLSEGMLVKGKKHQCPGPAKTGKSLVWLAHFARMAMAGERIIVLDRENGQDEYARRLNAIINDWKLTAIQIQAVQENLTYVEFPALRSNDADDLRMYMRRQKIDLIAFDSQRMFLTDLGLGEDKADDYAKFMAYIVDPVNQDDVTTLILDNTGHGEPERSRGTITKVDLNEVTLVMSVDEPFDLDQRGRVRLQIKETRFGNRGTWTMSIGGGHFGHWEQVESAVPAKTSGGKAEGLLIKILADEPYKYTKTKLREMVGGSRSAFDAAWTRLEQDGALVSRKRGKDDIWALNVKGES